ncbi:hypothetical protein Pfo_005404 [Paulownia fortunei]|nr:hypothetical protein Pfo_005404 [Paulownia fortunei]
MPEVSIGLYPDVGASYFLSRSLGRFGEYLGLTGARMSGTEMLECGLATHFVFSKDLKSLEYELGKTVDMNDGSAIANALEKIIHKPNLKQDSVCTREGRSLTLKECMSRDYTLCRHMVRRTFNNDFSEWEPPKLEEVSKEFVKQFFTEVDNDDDWDCGTFRSKNHKNKKF